MALAARGTIEHDKQGAASGDKKKISFPKKQATLTDCLLEGNEEREQHPGAVPIQGTNTQRSAVNNILDDNISEQNIGTDMDEDVLSSLVVAAELVQNDEETNSLAPQGTIWERKVQEEVDTRLQNLAVAEVVTKDEIGGVKRNRMVIGLLLTVIVLVGSIVTGFVIGINNQGVGGYCSVEFSCDVLAALTIVLIGTIIHQEDSSSQHSIENTGQKQDRLSKELKGRLNRTNSDEDFKPFEDASSPQSLALEWLLHDNITLTENAVTQKVLERYALAVLYYSTDGPNWINGSNFLTENDICIWNSNVPGVDWKVLGVYCPGPHQGLQLFLNEGGLSGTLPWELSLLSNVLSLQVVGNTLVGTIPTELGQMSALQEFVVVYNHLTGTIPTHLGQLTNLQRLDAFSGMITGTIPTELGRLTKLTSLGVDFNALTGTVPTELGLLAELDALYLSMNMLTRTIPTEMFQLTKLQTLYVHNNTLTGTIPTELGLLTELQRFYGHMNLLTGTIPSELGQMTGLIELLLRNNFLVGTLPTHLTKLTNLNFLSVESNKLTGTLPAELGKLTALQDILVGNNSLTGTLPTELGQLNNMRLLEIYCNKLTGPLPTELGQMTVISVLRLSNNSLTGTLPTDLVEMVYLGLLDLSNNLLTGTLPTELVQMVYLESLDLSNNLFTGTVPSELADNLGTNFSYYGNNFTDGK